MKEGIKTGLRKTRIPISVAAPLQQKYMVYQGCDSNIIKVMAFSRSSSWMFGNMVRKLNVGDGQGPPRSCGDLEGA